MGNHLILTMSRDKNKYFKSVETFQFHERFPEDSNNGLYLMDFYLPEEILSHILSYINPKEILKVTLVCKKWCNIIKSDLFWFSVYSRKYSKKPKKLPWYVYYCLMATDNFDTNFIKNGNGEEGFKHWNIILNYGDEFAIEDPPAGADPLPPNVPEFRGHTSCFATSYYECNKEQTISLEKKRLLRLIMDRYRPHVYLSEWVTARSDCGSVYRLWCKFFGLAQDPPRKNEDKYELLHKAETGTQFEQWAGNTWSKVELVVKDYPAGVRKIVFQHEGTDTQFWKGHYGSKMAGGVLKILFDSIEG